jgi:hypothetical protein
MCGNQIDVHILKDNKNFKLHINSCIWHLQINLKELNDYNEYIVQHNNIVIQGLLHWKQRGAAKCLMRASYLPLEIQLT